MEEISKIFKIYITRPTIDREMKILEQNGKFTTREVHELLVVILKHIYDRDNGPTIKPVTKE